jgi:hypothetical protein
MKTWSARVKEVYGALYTLESYDSVYGVVHRCGYKSAKALWRANPVIGGSVYPADFGVVKKGEKIKR